MKVLHTVDSVKPEAGGPSQSVPSLVRSLQQAGVDASLWTCDQGSAGDSHSDIAAPVGPLGQVVERLGRIDVIHDHGIWLRSNHQSASLATASGIVRVVSPRGMLEPQARQLRGWKKRVAWMFYQQRDLRSAAFLHATSDREKRGFRRLGLDQPAIVIPNGVDLPAPRGPVTPPASRTALFVGRIHPIKGLPALIEAWGQVAPAGWRMRVVGPDEGGHRVELVSRVEAAGLSDVWRFDGAVSGEERWRVMHQADLFILPTKTENFGIAVAEALACGLPVITTTGAPWEGLVSHRCGWWVNRSVESIAAALKEAAALSPEQRRAMGDRGRAWVEAEFSWRDIGRQMAGAYDEMLEVV